MTMPTRREFRVPGLNEPISHYTDAVSFGNLLFVSGIGPLAEDGSLVGGDDPAEQTRQIFRNLERVLRAAGASPADVLKVTVYLTDIADRTRINPARQEFFGAARPASTLVEVSRLAIPGMRVEIETVIGLPRQRATRRATRGA
ncbi:MAG TPA: RidA family protein [Candidatus Methylomirabilis sp.]|nr:RidA family protein [Candidatus Methylomirabilis sp.]